MALTSIPAKTVKLLLFVFNFIFLVIGLMLLILGIVIVSNFSGYISTIGSSFNIAPLIILLTGIITMVIAFCGCCGAVKESTCLMNTYSILLVILLVVQFVGVVCGFVYKSNIDSVAKDTLVEVVKEYNNSAEYKEFLDFMQPNLKCCGMFNYTEYEVYHVYGNASKVPESCCKTDNCDTNYTPGDVPNDIYTEGCTDKIISFFKSQIALAAGIGLAVCFIEILGILFACCVTQNIAKYEMV